MADGGAGQVRGTGKLIKELNRSRVLECFLGGGALSRVEVASRTGISLPAVSHLVSELESEGVLVRRGMGASSGGRRPVLYEYNVRHAYVVGLDIGGTKIAGGVTDLEGTPVAFDRLSTHGDGPDGEGLHRRVHRFVLRLLERAEVPPAKLMGVGIGVPGIPDPSGGDIHLAPGLHREAPSAGAGSAARHNGSGPPPDPSSSEPALGLPAYLEKELGRPVFVDNDVNMIVRGERWKGALRGVGHGVCVTVGTGVGVGLLLDGNVYQGAHGAAGEIGYWLIGALGPVVKSEGYGPLETFAAGPGIARRYRERAAARLGPEAAAMTARDVAEAAVAGDEDAIAVWRETTDVLGVALANLASLVDPEAIVIGGGVAGAPEELFLRPVRRIVAALAPYPPRVIGWELGEQAGVYGAVSMVVHSRRSSISYLSPEVSP